MLGNNWSWPYWSIHQEYFADVPYPSSWRKIHIQIKVAHTSPPYTENLNFTPLLGSHKSCRMSFCKHTHTLRTLTNNILIPRGYLQQTKMVELSDMLCSYCTCATRGWRNTWTNNSIRRNNKVFRNILNAIWS